MSPLDVSMPVPPQKVLPSTRDWFREECSCRKLCKTESIKVDQPLAHPTPSVVVHCAWLGGKSYIVLGRCLHTDHPHHLSSIKYMLKMGHDHGLNSLMDGTLGNMPPPSLSLVVYESTLERIAHRIVFTMRNPSVLDWLKVMKSVKFIIYISNQQYVQA